MRGLNCMLFGHVVNFRIGVACPTLHIRSWCAARGLPKCPRFNADVLRKLEEPHFTLHMANASKTRYLVRWLHSVLVRPGVSDTDYGCVRLSCFQGWVTFEDICDAHGRYIPRPQVEVGQQAVELALVSQNALEAAALARGRVLWHQTPKNHMATHMAYDMMPYANPRAVHNYPDEDLIGKVKRLMSKCHGLSAGRQGINRYMILIGTRWWDRLSQLRGLRS